MASLLDIDRLVDRFAPILYFHPEERYFPCSVQWYVRRAERGLLDLVLVVDDGVPQAHVPSILEMGGVLRTGEPLKSPNGIFFALLNRKGSFCIQRGRPGPNMRTLWCSPEAPSPGPFFHASMQRNGNFCIYAGEPMPPRGRRREPLWCARTSGLRSGPQYVASLRDDGNFCITERAPQGGDGRPGSLWCTDRTATVSDPRQGELSEAECYVHVKLAPDAGLDLQYWLFFPSKGPAIGRFGETTRVIDGLGEGAASWEHVTLRLDSSGTLTRVYFPAHGFGHGAWHPASALTRVDDRVIVFVARHSHALYPTIGSDDYRVVGGLALMDVRGQGERFDCRMSKVVSDDLSEGATVKEPRWVDHPGRWGVARPGSETTAARLLEAQFGPAIAPVSEAIARALLHDFFPPAEAGPKQTIYWASTSRT